MAELLTVFGKTIEQWPLTKLVPYEANPRKHKPEQVAQFAAAVQRYGWRYPILAKSDGLIVDGHFRLKVAAHLKMTHVPVIVVDDMSEDEVSEFRLSVNRMSELATWDQDGLIKELEHLEELGAPLGEDGPMGFGLSAPESVVEVGPWELGPVKDTFVLTVTGSLPLEAEVRARLKGLPGEVTIEASTLEKE